MRPARFGFHALWCLVLLFVSPLAAARPCPPLGPEPANSGSALSFQRDRGFLWVISKSGRVSYLYGTLHVGKREWAIPGPRVSAALQSSDVLALEIDPLDSGVLTAVHQAVTQGPQPRAFPSSLLQRLQVQVQVACLTPNERRLLDKAAPEIAITSLLVHSARVDGLLTTYSSDLILSQIGHRTGKRVISLEDPVKQLSMLTEDSPEALVRTMEQSLRSLENRSALRSMRRAARIWAESRFDELQRYPEWCECMDTPEQRRLMKKVLDDRNLLMAEQINLLHESGHIVFAAVGSLHLVGPLGLPALLQRRGYRVQRVNAATALPCWISTDIHTCTPSP